MFGAPLPQPSLSQDQPYMNPKQFRAYFDSCRETVFDILRTVNMGKPAFGRGGSKRGGGGRDLGPQLPPLPPPSPWQDILTDFYGVVLRYYIIARNPDDKHPSQDREQELRSGSGHLEHGEGGRGRLLPVPGSLRHLRPLRRRAALRRPGQDPR